MDTNQRDRDALFRKSTLNLTSNSLEKSWVGTNSIYYVQDPRVEERTSLVLSEDISSLPLLQSRSNHILINHMCAQHPLPMRFNQDEYRASIFECHLLWMMASRMPPSIKSIFFSLIIIICNNVILL